MLRTLVVAALILLAMPTQAGSEATAEPVVRTLDLPDTDLGTPFLRADPAFWMPILREEGYVRAAQAAQSQSSQPMPMPEAEEDERIQHDFLPLGDANGNGRDDVILLTTDGDETTLKALDGGRLGDVLWTFELPEEDYIYLHGDVDEDGVYDLELLQDAGSDGDESEDPYGQEWEQRSTATLLSGRDLAQLAIVQLVARSSYEETHPQPEPVPVGRSTYTYRQSMDYVHDLEDQPGMARITWTFEDHETQDRVLVTTDYSYSFNFSSSMVLLSPDGALVWEYAEKGWDLAYGSLDATGDAIPDVLVHSNDHFGVSNGGFGPRPPVPPPVPVPILYPEEPQRPPYQIRLLDGTDGSVVWQTSLGNVTYSNVDWVGDLYGDGPVLYAYVEHFDDEDYSQDGFTQRTMLLDGRTGKVLHEIDGGLWLIDLGDANGDGRDDVLNYDFNDSTLSFKAMDGDLDELWTLSIDDDEFYGFADMTGDGVLDLLSRDDDNVTVHSGTNGDAAWSVSEARLASMGVAPGILLETDRELAFLLSDAKDHEDLADHAAELLLVRGSDGAPLWRKPLYDPADYTEVAGDDAYLWLAPAGDLTGDGANDFIVTFEQSWFITMSHVCDDDGCETETEDSRDEDEGQPLDIVALVDGASGATIARFDDMELNEKVKKVTEEAVELEAASEELAEELGEEPAPGAAFYATLVAVGLAFIMRRRR